MDRNPVPRFLLHLDVISILDLFPALGVEGKYTIYTQDFS